MRGRYVFYNNSAFDGNDPAANAGDDGAIAPDKIALLPGQIATYANYTSYSNGINGIMVDISGLGGTPTAEDFRFKVGNVNNPTSWVTAPTPSSITVRSGAGTAGSDRITIIWPASVIQNRWLEVTVLMTPGTGLSSQDVFYFGNAIGEPGLDSDGDGFSNLDELRAGTNPLDSSDCLRTILSQNADGDEVIEFCTVPGKLYRVERNDNFPTGIWNLLVDDVPGTGGLLQVVDPEALTLPKAVYRVIVKP